MNINYNLYTVSYNMLHCILLVFINGYANKISRVIHVFSYMVPLEKCTCTHPTRRDPRIQEYGITGYCLSGIPVLTNFVV